MPSYFDSTYKTSNIKEWKVPIPRNGGGTNTQCCMNSSLLNLTKISYKSSKTTTLLGIGWRIFCRKSVKLESLLHWCNTITFPHTTCMPPNHYYYSLVQNILKPKSLPFHRGSDHVWFLLLLFSVLSVLFKLCVCVYVIQTDRDSYALINWLIPLINYI